MVPGVKISINDSSVQERVRRCWHVMIRERILKMSTTDRGSSLPPGDIEIEVPSEQDGRVRAVSPGIFQGLLKLRAARPIIPFAFQVQVIGDDYFPAMFASLTNAKRPPILS